MGVYNIETWKLEFSTEAGHAETIFDLRFKPGDKNQLATCSYDGTIRLWDVRTMKLLTNIITDKAQPGEKVQKSLQKQGHNVLYSIAWGPG